MDQYPFTAASIAVGEKYASWAVTMIETLRSYGRYRGDVWMITDRPGMFERLKGVRCIEVDDPEDTIAIKTYKTRLFDLIDVPMILFLDVDVLIGRDIKRWFTSVHAMLASYPLLVFEDKGMDKVPFHTGVMLMKREAQPLLAKWRAGLERGEYDRDQKAFRAIMPADRIGLMPKDFLLFPEKDDFMRLNSSTFVHITFTGRQVIHELADIRSYLKSCFKVNHMPSNCTLRALAEARLRKVIWNLRVMFDPALKEGPS